MLVFTELPTIRFVKSVFLFDADIQEHLVAQLSGHKSMESLKSYKTQISKLQSQKKDVVDTQQSPFQ